ncbi:MAG: NAD-binding protein [Anaerolineaceae bacterium]|nr:NAD-binding protein [Anaerolineaceae bacterium]
MFKQIWRDLRIIFSSIWINLSVFVLLLVLGAVLLRIFGNTPDAGWPQLLLDAFYLASINSIDSGGKIVPVLLAFIMPIGMAIILGEGVLRIFSIYMQRHVNRKEWDLMVVKTFTQHTVMCGVGEMGRQLLKRMILEQPQMELVLIDPRSGLLAELGLDKKTVHFQGDMADVETLEQANIRSAKLVILTAGEDALNLEVAYKIQQINPNVTVWVRLHHSGLAELLDLSRKPQIHFFCPYQQAAEAIVEHIMEKNIV